MGLHTIFIGETKGGKEITLYKEEDTKYPAEENPHQFGPLDFPKLHLIRPDGRLVELTRPFEITLDIKANTLTVISREWTGIATGYMSKIARVIREG